MFKQPLKSNSIAGLGNIWSTGLKQSAFSDLNSSTALEKNSVKVDGRHGCEIGRYQNGLFKNQLQKYPGKHRQINDISS